jgi:single-stranded-DNA-specific exonuclease
MKDFKTKLLEYYGLSQDDYSLMSKKLSLNDLPSFKKYNSIEECAKYLHEAIKNKVKILIYGDYDCDGVMSTSITYLTLKSNDYTPGFYIPFRETDGYGLTKENIKKFYDLNYKILLLVDNGITLNDEIDYANSLGMDVIILDHHTIEGSVPKAKFILHPLYSAFSKINMCAGSIAFFFSIAYLGVVDEYLLTLSMISTISDLMELKDENRILVKLGLDALNKNKYPNILKLINKDTLRYNENDVGMTLAPKINAIGRIITDNKLFDIIRYFINFNNVEFINKTAVWINNTNQYRKQLVKNLTNNINVDENEHSIVIVEENLKEGLTGLVASKYMEESDKPTVVLVPTSKDNNYLKGSIRSKNGFDVNIILDDVKDLLVVYGGHSNAGGLTLKRDQFQEFKKRFEIAASKHPFVQVEEKYIDISIDDINKENYDLIESLSPYGQGFKKPQFVIKGYRTNLLKTSRDGKHIITRINPSSSLIYFNFDKSIMNYELVNLYGYYDLNYFNGFCTIQFHVSSFLKYN